ncbi:unnamed protein product [Linum tenue]|uniref:Uncharacterized protein n=1 Tax=Linum tenue TaxID=586396 RepID=A0AAV0LDY2_9ROSI|nr:unnamed protein product [Linum tenue]
MDLEVETTRRRGACSATCLSSSPPRKLKLGESDSVCFSSISSGFKPYPAHWRLTLISALHMMLSGGSIEIGNGTSKRPWLDSFPRKALMGITLFLDQWRRRDDFIALLERAACDDSLTC